VNPDDKFLLIVLGVPAAVLFLAILVIDIASVVR
jgi:hypothetical protein